MVDHSRGEDRVIAGERAGDVLGALARAEPDLLLLDVDRMGAELDGGHLGRAAGPRRGLLEDEGDALAGERRAEIGPLGEAEYLLERPLRQRGDAEQVGHQSRSFLTIVPIPSSVRISISRAWGTRPSMRWAEPTSPATASAQARSLGIMPALTLSWAIRSRSSAEVSRGTSVASSLGSSSRPGAAER